MKLLWLFRHPTPAEIVKHQYEDARRKLLEHTSLWEFHEAMAQMLKARANRLANEINRAEEESN